MSSVGNKFLKIALKDAIERQRLITAELKKLPEQTQLHKVVAEQTRKIKETLRLFDQIS